ncbi:MAG: small basic protein [Planctomycetes bacterium]|nr:small basic protein [Planctomycetota bacterium]
MSIHASLKGVNTLIGERSVLTRVERINKLKRDGRFDTEAASVYGLPKVRTKFKVVSGKKAKALENARKEALASKGGKAAKGKK